MALFHLHVTQVKRSAGQSAVACAAYRAGEKLFSEYYGEVNDFTRKSGVICSGILLPPQAPAEYQDRSTLWNAVEKVERSKTAQLAYSFNIALQNEFSLEENIALARQFVSEQLVGRGMIADFAIHQPDKEDGGIPNPHFHILCPIRPIEDNGKWGYKQRRVYRLDEDGNRIMGEDGKPLFDAVPTTDWGQPETLEHWREAWATMVNAKFEEKGLTCRVDHRSYERQGVDVVPTVHEGVAVRQMEAKGITTDKGDFNRWIKKARNLLRDIKRKIADLTDWIITVKNKLSKPQAPDLATLLTDYYEGRNAVAWSRNVKIGNLKNFAEAVKYLTEKGIATLDDLEAHNIVGKGDKIRTLYLPPKAVAHLRQYIRIFHGLNPAPDSYVFYSRNTGPDGKMSQAAIRKMLKKYAVTAHEKCSDVPLDLHAHQFRHAKATHWLEDGINIVQISFLLGHEQLDTTMRYLDITTEQEAAALSTLEEERHKNIRPKWNSEKDSLSAMCSLRKLKKQ